MSDYLLDLGRRPLARKLVKQLNIPLSLPETLKRSTSAWTSEELKGSICAIGGSRHPQLIGMLTGIITGAGGVIEAHSSTPPLLLNAILFDAMAMTSTAELSTLYDFIKPRLKVLAKGGRVLLFGDAVASAATPEAAACAKALVGFAKSLSKEIGRKGSTCQVLLVRREAATSDALAVPVQFFLSPRSAFISGQALTIGVAAPYLEAGLVKPLAGKTALVTGAAHGIGAAICRHLAAEGAHIAGHDRPQEKGALAALMQELGGTCLIADLLDPHGMRLLLQQVGERLGGIDILVNNAGITRDKTLAHMPRDYWDDTITVNLAAPIGLTNALLNTHDAINRGGRIICLASISGLAGNVGQTNYAAAKAGLTAYVRALAPAAAAKDITVNALAPGFIETRMTSAMPVAVREVARRFNALNQGGLPDDVAEAAVFLALPGSGGISGSVLRVCGQNLVGA